MEILDKHFYLMKQQGKKNVEVEIRAGLRIAQGAVPAKWGRKMCFQVLLATVRLAQPGEASCSS